MLISIKEAADLKKISASLFHYYLREKKIIPSQMIGGRAYFDEDYIKTLKIVDGRYKRNDTN